MDHHNVNLHIDKDQMAGAYSNFANVYHSEYEVTIDFPSVATELMEAEVEEIPGIIVARIRMSHKFAEQLRDTLIENLARKDARDHIRSLPEVEPNALPGTSPPFVA